MLGRQRFKAPNRYDDRGAVAVMFAIFLIVFMVLLAFVVDLGQVYAKKAQMQGVVDAAALAGVGVLSCTGDARSAAQTEAALYGGTYNGVPVVVSATSNTVMRASATSTVKTFFGGFAGRPTIDVMVDATASKDCSGGYALFTGTGGFKFSGGMDITGSVYSSGDIDITSGNNSIVSGSIDYSGTCKGCDKVTVSSAKNAPATPLNGGLDPKTPRCYAYEIKIDGFGGTTCVPSKANDSTMLLQANTWVSTSSCSSASFPSNPYLDCGSKDVSFTSWPTTLRGVKTSGKITIDNSITIGNATTPVILYTTNSDDKAIEVKGSNSLKLYGYLYAPNGGVYVGGSKNIEWVGSVIAKEADINGTGSGGGDAGFLAVAGTGRLTE